MFALGDFTEVKYLVSPYYACDLIIVQISNV